MSKAELEKTLEKLHEELAQTPQLDENSIQSMRVVLGEIQTALSRAEMQQANKAEADDSQNVPVLSTSDNLSPSNDADQESPLSQRLQELIADFEARHPKLTVTLTQIADRLTDMGI